DPVLGARPGPGRSSAAGRPPLPGLVTPGRGPGRRGPGALPDRAAHPAGLGRGPAQSGGLHEEQGELEQAEEAFRAALRRQPGFALPHARLATLLRGKLTDADLAALEQRLADPQLAQGPRARLLFGLAHVL